MSTQGPFVESSAYYVGLGWKIFPLAPGTKVPQIKGGGGFKSATDDAAIIGDWEKRFPNANVGIATGEPSGILVIDIDPRNGGDRTVARLAANSFAFPHCPEAKTGNGGRHLIFAYDARVRTSKDRLGPGIDVKADGGYIVGAPSRIAKSDQGHGGTYRWLVEPQIRLPRLPMWVFNMLVPRERPAVRFERVATTTDAAKSLEGLARSVASAGKGSRNNILNWAAYQAGKQVQAGKLSTSAVVSRLTQAGLSAGLHIKDIEATIASGLRGASQG